MQCEQCRPHLPKWVVNMSSRNTRTTSQIPVWSTKLPIFFCFPTSHIEPELFTPSCRSPSDVKKCFCNESDVRGTAGFHFGCLKYSKSNLTAQSEVQSAAGNFLSQSWARCVSFSPWVSHRTCYCSLSCMPVIAAVWSCRGGEMHCIQQSCHCICAAVLWSDYLWLCVWWSMLVFSSASSGPLSLSFVLWLWLHPVSSQKRPPPPPPPAYDMV